MKSPKNTLVAPSCQQRSPRLFTRRAGVGRWQARRRRGRRRCGAAGGAGGARGGDAGGGAGCGSGAVSDRRSGGRVGCRRSGDGGAAAAAREVWRRGSGRGGRRPAPGDGGLERQLARGLDGHLGRDGHGAARPPDCGAYHAADDHHAAGGGDARYERGVGLGRRRRVRRALPVAARGSAGGVVRGRGRAQLRGGRRASGGGEEVAGSLIVQRPFGITGNVVRKFLRS